MTSLAAVKDRAEISSLLEKDDLFKEIYQVDEWHPSIISLQHSYYKVIDNKKLVGIFMVSSESKTSLSFHGGVFKKYRGDTTRIVTNILKQIKKHLPNFVIWTKVSSNNPMALGLVKSLGCREFGRLPMAVDKNELIFYRWN
jgi:hypothetical protein